MVISILYIVVIYIISMAIGFILFDFIEYIVSKYNSIKEESEQKQHKVITDIINSNIDILFKKLDSIENTLNNITS
ncbi:hypothetical protein [Alphaentomopoxvirus acuprea]|uniref:Uncharacterized protein n=1 Tax=Alphaentomopoxvirus acuprea TaxID=62099 RepID=W6JPL5_9POXV|nr:hypothetical protein BA82_gp129 [Anomala cuprea entomopoxvirus]BAO49489.1 hypothetical protein [Anomala cuprea entomopoxvirus]